MRSVIKLRDLQHRCYDAFVMGDEHALTPFVISDHIPAAARVQVYQNNVQEGFIETLGTSYPVIVQLVGEDCFRTLAQDYLRRYPSVSGDLGDFGAHFAVLLDAMYDGSEFAYLADMARVEWACEQVRGASDAVLVDLAALQASAGEAFGEMRFALHPAVRLIASDHPVFSIWQAHQSEVVGDVEVNGGERLLVMRRVGDVELQLVEPAAYLLLQSLQAGDTLLDGIDAAVAQFGDSAAIAALQRVVALAVLVDPAVVGRAGVADL